MKKILSTLFAAVLITTTITAQMEPEKKKIASPPAKVETKLKKGGAAVSINYSQPSVKNRVIGKDVEPMDGKVWRTGANDATVFETDKDLTVNGEKLPAGKYGFFTLFEGQNVTIIFNKVAKQWGAFKYSDAEDALRVKTTWKEKSTSTETMTFTITKKGTVTLLWGTRKVEFKIK